MQASRADLLSFLSLDSDAQLQGMALFRFQWVGDSCASRQLLPHASYEWTPATLPLAQDGTAVEVGVGVHTGAGPVGRSARRTVENLGINFNAKPLTFGTQTRVEGVSAGAPGIAGKDEVSLELRRSSGDAERAELDRGLVEVWEEEEELDDAELFARDAASQVRARAPSLSVAHTYSFDLICLCTHIRPRTKTDGARVTVPQMMKAVRSRGESGGA